MQESEWKALADEFAEHWNFPNCIGAIDGKHIVMKRPINSGLYYFNYKGTFSVVLLALVNADYKFIFIGVGCNGRISNDRVFRNSPLSKALSENTLGIPNTRYLDLGREFPDVIIAGDEFPLKNHIMKPYVLYNLTIHRRIFNYHLGRGRRIVKNAFGILICRLSVFFDSVAAFS